MPVFFVSQSPGTAEFGDLPTIRHLRESGRQGYHFGDMTADRIERITAIAKKNHGSNALALAATIMAETGALPKRIIKGQIGSVDKECERVLRRLSKGPVRFCQLFNRRTKDLTEAALVKLVAEGKVFREERKSVIRSKHMVIWYGRV